MPKYKVRYTFDINVEAINESVAKILADLKINPDCCSYLWKYLIDKKIITIEFPEDLKDEVENGKATALSLKFKGTDNSITDGFVADEFIMDENLRKMIWPEDENFEIPIDESETIKIEIVDSVTASELYEKRMLDNLVNYTCHLCKDKNNCKYAFDDYCTDGNCLMEK